MTLNTLRIEPHIVKPDPEKESDAPNGGVVLWQIWVDDEKLTELANPFTSSYTIPEMFANPNYPHWGDGLGYLSVRKVKDKIIWCPQLPEDQFFGSLFFNLRDEGFIFDWAAYQSAILSAIEKSRALSPKFFLKEDSHDESWLLIEQSEILYILKMTYPQSFHETAIYRNSSSATDTTGTILLRRMEKAIKALTDVEICDPPEKQIELRIGLDEPEFTEAIWHIGKVNGQFAIHFEHRPSFPVWLQSPEFDKVLSQEPFIKEL